MTSLDQLEELQADLNQRIYNDLVKYLNDTSHQVDNAQAFNLLLNAVAANLGAMLAQVPEPYRNSFVKLSNEIITHSLTETLKEVDNMRWGQIGHA
jgi:hypothetical protein